ncbi:hypothetical protein L9F63_021150, partial [Diploptera punctata]
AGITLLSKYKIEISWRSKLSKDMAQIVRMNNIYQYNFGLLGAIDIYLQFSYKAHRHSFSFVIWQQRSSPG